MTNAFLCPAVAPRPGFGELGTTSFFVAFFVHIFRCWKNAPISAFPLLFFADIFEFSEVKCIFFCAFSHKKSGFLGNEKIDKNFLIRQHMVEFRITC